MTIRDSIHALLAHAIEGVADIPLTVSEHAVHGDYTTPIALTLAKEWKEAPRVIAERIAALIQKAQHPIIERVEIAGPGHLNFFVRKEVLWKQVPKIIKAGEGYGASKIGKKEKVVVEFISANPTGPLTLANARGGFFGDTLANVLTLTGHRVQREYYVNDAGNQVRTLGESVLAALGEAVPSEKHYQGSYIKEWAELHRKEIHGKDVTTVGAQFAKEILTDWIQPPVAKMGIHFDRWFRESTLHKKPEARSQKQEAKESAVDRALVLLKKKGHVYEHEGAIWFRTTTFGDDKDRVLVTSDGYPTYYLADIAHYMVIRKEGWKRYINFLGADHHGYIGRAKAAGAVLGYTQFDLLIMQLVKLMSGGQEVRMSKRRGTYVTIEDLLDEIPVDVARFFFLMYASSSHLDFDLDRAKEQSSKNPVYYVQYAYTRLGQILKKADGITESQNHRITESHPAETALLKFLFRWPELVEDVSRTYEVHRIPTFALKLADHLHAFYDSCRVIDNGRVHKHRLQLVRAAHAVFGAILKTTGISRPERM
ncbi:arginine--tRNA ligase [Candidatus Uhrbacteria bacterium]|nr:arginine--tRNA ligase [Candidatus Uhrbacteria bacterium]